MRSIRAIPARALGGTMLAAVVLAAALAPAAAQVDTASATEGTIEGCQAIAVGSDGTGPGASAASVNQVWKCQGSASDERLQGDIDLVYNVAGWTDVGAIEWGWASITNDGGSWKGTWSSTVNPAGEQVIMAWYVGEGGYEGWSYVETQYGGYQADRNTFGIAYPGDLPPNMVSVPLEPTELPTAM